MGSGNFGAVDPCVTGRLSRRTSLRVAKREAVRWMAQAGKPLESVYFLSSGIGSVLAVSETGLKAEAGMFGREGFAPTASSVGANTNPCAAGSYEK